MDKFDWDQDKNLHASFNYFPDYSQIKAKNLNTIKYNLDVWSMTKIHKERKP